jgi:hypothetical protein
VDDTDYYSHKLDQNIRAFGKSNPEQANHNQVKQENDNIGDL